VLDGDGNEVPSTDHRIHFHHVVGYSSKERDPACGGTSERFVAPGSERTDLVLPDGYGYYTNARDSWYGNYDIMNLSASAQRVTVKYDVVYTKDRTGLHDVTPWWLDNAGCFGAGTITVPGGGEPGSVYTKTSGFTLKYPGKVVAVRGHVHDRGIDATLTAANGDVICHAVAEYDDGSDGTPPPTTTTMPGMDHGDHDGDDHGGTDPGGGMDHGHSESGPRLKAIPLCKNLSYPVAAGERVNVSVRYHNEERLTDAMGKMLVYVAEDRPPVTTTTRAPRTTAAPVPTTTPDRLTTD
jgi:hypothetical protein